MKYPLADFKVGDIVQIINGTDEYLMNVPAVIDSINPFNMAPFEVRVLNRQSQHERTRFCKLSQIEHSEIKKLTPEELEEESLKEKMKKIGNKVRNRRERCHLTRDQLSKETGASWVEIEQLEQGKAFLIDEEVAKKMVRKLKSKRGVELPYLELLGKEKTK